VNTPMICVRTKAEYFFVQGWTGQITLQPLGKIAFLRRPPGADGRADGREVLWGFVIKRQTILLLQQQRTLTAALVALACNQKRTSCLDKFIRLLNKCCCKSVATIVPEPPLRYHFRSWLSVKRKGSTRVLWLTKRLSSDARFGSWADALASAFVQLEPVRSPRCPLRARLSAKRPAR
jgi:hypothetical protein